MTLAEDDQGHEADGATEHSETKVENPPETVVTPSISIESPAKAEHPGDLPPMENSAQPSVAIKEEPTTHTVGEESTLPVPAAAGVMKAEAALDAQAKQPESDNMPSKDSDDPTKEHLPEPPASPTSNTAFSGSGASTSTSAIPDLPA